MRIFFSMTVLALAALGQTQKLPSDVDPQSYSRLPLMKRETLSGDALRAYDAVAGKDANGKERPTPPLGPQATSMYSMGVAEPIDRLNQYLRSTVVGPQMFQICTLIAAREFDENYEWTAHEAGAKRVNVDMKTIDAIRFNRGVEGLPDQDALVIRFGRALFRDHTVTPELYKQVVDTFGKQGMYELVAVMGDYGMVAMMLRAVDQQVPNSTGSLPVIKR